MDVRWMYWEKYGEMGSGESVDGIRGDTIWVTIKERGGFRLW